MGEALRYVTQLAGLKMKITPGAVIIVPLSEPTDTLVTKEYMVPPGFFSTSGAAGAANQPEAPSSIPRRLTALDFLKAAGVDFPPGASANFLPGSSKLIVRNTESNLDLVDQITEASTAVQANPPGGMAGDLINPNTIDQPVFDTRKMPEALKSAGLLPMKLDLEHVGRQFSFDGFYAAESVSFHYVDWWSQARRGWIWWVAGGIAFFAMGGFGAWRRLVWGALVLTFIPICIAQSLTGMCNSLLAGWFTGFVIYQIATRLVFRRRVVVEVPAV